MKKQLSCVHNGLYYVQIMNISNHYYSYYISDHVLVVFSLLFSVHAAQETEHPPATARCIALDQVWQ
jgi:hypothetical protein